MKLENRKVIITGGAQGMGGTITRKLAEELRAMGVKAGFQEGDATVERDVMAVVDAARSFFGGRIDVLVNAAGATGPIETPGWEIKAEDFSDVAGRCEASDRTGLPQPVPGHRGAGSGVLPFG